MPPLHILWRDEHLVAVYKPAGWLVHRTGLDAGETRFVMQTLRDQLGQQRLWLHAWQLTVPHPVSGAALVFDSGLELPAWSPTNAAEAHAVLPDNGAAAPTADWQRLLAQLPWHASPGAR